MAGTTVTTERRNNARGRGGRTTPTVKLRRNHKGEVILFADLKARGLISGPDIARHLGCAQSTVSRLANDNVDPGLAFIACVAEACPDVPLSRYFDSPYFAFAPKAA